VSTFLDLRLPPRHHPTWTSNHTHLNAPTSSLTGLTQLGARNYNPAIDRFLAVDPILNPADAQPISGYAYAGNNPITHSDPSGLQRQPLDDGVTPPPCETDTQCGRNDRGLSPGNGGGIAAPR
jgi:RHS repeat-associated protein